MTARQPAGIPAGGQFAATGRGRALVSLDEPETFTPGGDGWVEGVYESSIPYHRRSFEVSDGGVVHQSVYSTTSGDTYGQADVLAHGGLTIARGAKYPGELHYRLLRAPRVDTGEMVEAVFVNWVEIKGNRGKGWASAMYAAVREAHPDAIIPAANILEAPGKRLVRHYRAKYPDVHTGRFDTQGRIHPTSGPDDPIYRRSALGELE